jgi:hypothetical protein
MTKKILNTLKNNQKIIMNKSNNIYQHQIKNTMNDIYKYIIYLGMGSQRRISNL